MKQLRRLNIIPEAEESFYIWSIATAIKSNRNRMKLAHAFSTSILWRGMYFLSLLILNILISRHFKAEGSGQIFYITSVFAFLVIVASFCLEVPMGYYLSKKIVNETRLGVSAVLWWLLTAVPIYLIVVAAGYMDEYLGQNDFSFPAFAFLSGNILVTFFVALFYAKLDFALPNIVLVIVNIGLIVTLPNNTVAEKFISNTGYVNLYFLSFLFQGLLLVTAFFIRYFKKADWGVIPRHLFRSFFNFAFIALVTNALSFLMYRIDYLFVNKYCNASDLGNYIQACKLAQLFFILPAILASVIFPMTASGQNDEINLKMQIVSRGMILGYAIVLLGLMLSGYWLFPFVFGLTFQSMYIPFLLLMPGILAYSVIHLLAAYFSGKKVLSIGFWGNVITLFFIVAGDIIVIPEFGINGAAIISSLGYIFLMCIMIYAHRRKYNSSFRDFLLFRNSDLQLLRKILLQTVYSRKPSEI